MILRKYQEDAVNALWDELCLSQSALCVMSTGSGKTEVMIAFIQKAFELKPSFKVCILLNKIDLLNQTVKRFKKYFENVSEYCGSNKKSELHHQIVIATIQSIENEKIEDIDLIVIDECHRFNFEEGTYKNFIDLNPCKVLGFTATPWRNSAKMYGDNKFFKEITYKKDILELIEEKFLVMPSMKSTGFSFDTSNLSLKMGDFDQSEINALVQDEKKISDQVQDALSRTGDRKKIVWACAHIEHAKKVHSKIPNAAIIHSKLSKEDRAINFDKFMNGNAKHLVFVTIVSEGFDYPPIDTVVFMRPTRSPVLYVQTVGRGLRPSEGKENCLVLDYAEVVKNCGTISNPILTEKGSTKKNKELYDFKVCAKCFEIIQKYPCKACGFEPPKKESKINLKNIPDSESSIIGQSKFIFEVRDVSFSRHISKNKNECLKVTYLAQNFFDGLIEEFFMMGAPWAEKKCSQRMLELGVVFTSDLEYLAKRKPTRIPKKLEYEIDGKFKKVKRLVFV